MGCQLKNSLVLALLASTVALQPAHAAVRKQQQISPVTAPGYDASADTQDKADGKPRTVLSTTTTATNAYEKDSTGDTDMPFSEEELESMFKPVFSSDEESPDQAASRQVTGSATAASASANGPPHPIKLEKAAPKHAVEQHEQQVSFDDLTLGLDEPLNAKSNVDTAPNRYEGEEILSGNSDTVMEGGQRGQRFKQHRARKTTGPGKPGEFTGGPSLAEQHEGWKYDNPETVDGSDDTSGTFVAAGGGRFGGLNKHVLNSLNDDLSFYLQKHGVAGSRRRAARRSLLQSNSDNDAATGATATDASSEPSNSYEEGRAEAQDTPEDASNVYERDVADKQGSQGSEAAQDKAGYTSSAFELPESAVHAARAQREELQRQLVASRVPKVRPELSDIPDASALQAAEASITSAASLSQPVGGPPGRSARKLFGAADTGAQLLNSKGGRGRKPLWGLTYSWRRAEDCDGGLHQCRCPHPADLETDLDLLYKYSLRIRTYSVECPDLMRMLLHYTTAEPQTSWLLGIWIGRDTAQNQAQIDLLAKLLPEFPNANLAGIVVGNEAISRQDVTQSQLIDLIGQVKNMVRAIGQKTNSQMLLQVPVLTAELPTAYTPQLVSAVGVVGANIQPFYLDSIDTSDASGNWVKSAVSSTMQQYSSLQDRSKGKQVVITEVGWPTRSGELDTNRASAENSAAFARAWTQAAEKQNVPYYYHELADAAWKGALRKGAAAAARATTNKKGRRQPGLLNMGILGDEYFGLVTADRSRDKGIVQPLASKR